VVAALSSSATSSPAAAIRLFDSSNHHSRSSRHRSPHGVGSKSGYFHGNTAGRAINIYNGEVGGNNPITHHRIHDNVIVDQVWDGVMFGIGVVGENWEWNDLIINVGLDGGSGSVGSRAGIKLQPANPPGVTSGLPIIMHLFNNTVLNAGAVGARQRRLSIGLGDGRRISTTTSLRSSRDSPISARQVLR
jgi:hypothetical protein